MPIDFRNVSKSYRGSAGSHLVLSDIDLTVSSGEMVVLIGPNGSGKSTIVRLAAGLISPEQGTVTVMSTEQLSNSQSPRIAYATQDFRSTTFPWLTVRENVTLVRNLAAFPASAPFEIADQLLNMFVPEINPQGRVYELSGGQQQLVCLCRALAANGDILLGDEPLSALDVARGYEVVELLRQFWATTASARLWVSHNIDEAVLLADRIVLLSKRSRSIDRIIEVPTSAPRTVAGLLTTDLASTRSEILEFLLSERTK